MGVTGNFWPSQAEKLPVFAQLGPFFVCIFFCISGYLILKTLPKSKTIGQFALNRVKRIYPVFFILNLIMFTVGPFANYEWMGELKHNPIHWITSFISNSLFLPGIFPLPIAQKNAWSLSYEALFYLISAVCFFSFARYRFMSILGVLLGTYVVWRFPYASFFLVGAAWCYLPEMPKVRRLLGGPAGLVALLASLWSFSINHYLALVPAFMFFGSIAYEQGWLSRFLRFPCWQFLGAISYSLYLIHPFAMDAVRRILSKLFSEPVAGPIFLIVGPISAIGLSYLSYLWIEKRLTDRIFVRGTSSAPLKPAITTT